MSEQIEKWEYRVESFGNMFSGPKDEALAADLDIWGAEGWEVISIIPRTNSDKLTVIAKRPLTLSARRQRSIP